MIAATSLYTRRVNGHKRLIHSTTSPRAKTTYRPRSCQLLNHHNIPPWATPSSTNHTNLELPRSQILSSPKCPWENTTPPSTSKSISPRNWLPRSPSHKPQHSNKRNPNTTARTRTSRENCNNISEKWWNKLPWLDTCRFPAPNPSPRDCYR